MKLFVTAAAILFQDIGMNVLRSEFLFQSFEIASPRKTSEEAIIIPISVPYIPLYAVPALDGRTLSPCISRFPFHAMQLWVLGALSPDSSPNGDVFCIGLEACL